MATRAPATPSSATRFTSTGPYAYRKPIVPLAQQLAATGETPQQRIARLRAQADEAKMKLNEIPWIDRVIDRGRVWADKAHRVTVYGLIGATIVCGAVTAYTVVDIVTTNRRNLRIYGEAEKFHLENMTPESRMLAVRAAQNFNLPEDRAAFYVDNQVRLKQREIAGKIVAEQMRAAGLKPEEEVPSTFERFKEWGRTLFSSNESNIGIEAPKYEFVRDAAVPVEEPRATLVEESQKPILDELKKEQQGKVEDGKSSWGTVKGWFGRS